MSDVTSDNLEKHPKLEGSVGIVQPQTVTLFEPPNLLHLECGRTLGPIQVTYETCGKLNAEKTNAVLIFHALSGDAHVAGYHNVEDRKPGWWENMVGPGKGIDTDKYFVICANTLGGCKGTTGPSSINPATGKPWGLDFPVITIEDMVKVQKGLIDSLGIKQLLGVIGGSMGGMLVLEWMVRYPDHAKAAIPVATTPRQSAQCIAFDAVGRNAILADPNFKCGQYHEDSPPEDGLAIARMVGHITYLSEQGMHEKFGRQLRNAEKYSYDFTNEFSVETYLDYQGRAFVQRFDANSYLYITKALGLLRPRRPIRLARQGIRERQGQCAGHQPLGRLALHPAAFADGRGRPAGQRQEGLVLGDQYALRPRRLPARARNPGPADQRHSGRGRRQAGVQPRGRSPAISPGHPRSRPPGIASGLTTIASRISSPRTRPCWTWDADGGSC